MSEWQKIETAPKDETRFAVLWSGPMRNISIVTGRELSWYAKGEATHWTPLPEPPKLDE